MDMHIDIPLFLIPIHLHSPSTVKLDVILTIQMIICGDITILTIYMIHVDMQRYSLTTEIDSWFQFLLCQTEELKLARKLWHVFTAIKSYHIKIDYYRSSPSMILE
jgi:hypothetical protein